MNIKETAVTNAANLSFFMVNFSYALLQLFQQQNPAYIIGEGIDRFSFYFWMRRSWLVFQN